VSALDALLRAAREGRPFEASAYTDESLFARERAALFDRGWFAAAGLADAATPGAWTRVREADPRLVIACGADLERRAWFDVCRHRGAPLLPEDERGVERALCATCPYHGWRYGLDGKRLGVARDERSDADLVRAACARRGAQWWARFDAPPATRSWDERGAPPWLDELDEAPLVCARSVRWEVRANWKFVVENFQESHHFTRVHPTLERWTPWQSSSSQCDASAWWLSGEMPLVDEAETVSESGRAMGRRWIVEDERERRRVRDAYVFPNALYSRQPDYLLAYRFFLTAVDRTVVRCDTLVHAASPRGAALDDVTRFWDRIHDEDRAICEGQQRCAGSRGFAPAGYDRSEDGVRAFDVMVATALQRATG
jgi:Rieske 2Fe-2S family protein